ncbi:hypothetical protein Salat_2100800 [Sesamum alatum]|uniref:Uncharacterized protein n=1 Tax=Sesamum alatum TaxID=300844 RepID=A0AAE2CGS6_9LAMI|nr:hypothetical protein Salat_2100800 [Sesamum alatum]
MLSPSAPPPPHRRLLTVGPSSLLLAPHLLRICLLLCTPRPSPPLCAVFAYASMHRPSASSSSSSLSAHSRFLPSRPAPRRRSLFQYPYGSGGTRVDGGELHDETGGRKAMSRRHGGTSDGGTPAVVSSMQSWWWRGVCHGWRRRQPWGKANSGGRRRAVVVGDLGSKVAVSD